MNEFGNTSAEELFSVFPEWRLFSRSERAEDGTSFLVIDVPALREAAVEHGLAIDTANDEITVGFDSYHSHFDEWSGDGDQFGTMAALQFIRQIISERIAVVSWWNDERWCGSAQLEAGKRPEIPKWNESVAFNRIRIRSWKGTLNADISVSREP